MKNIIATMKEIYDAMILGKISIKESSRKIRTYEKTALYLSII